MVLALLSAVFASLVAIFGKIGIKDIDSNLATTIRALIMFLFLLIIILFQGKLALLNKVTGTHMIFIVLAGIAGALSWLCYFLALKAADASKVAVLDRLSVAFVFVFSVLLLGEKFEIKNAVAVAMIVGGAILMIIQV